MSEKLQILQSVYASVLFMHINDYVTVTNIAFGGHICFTLIS